MKSTYLIHKGIGRPVEFQGLVGQFIWWMGGVLVALLLLFAILYLLAIPLWFCVCLTCAIGTIAYILLARISRLYGADGWMKKKCSKYIPKQLKSCAVQ